jgi:DNA recombination protein RmuC
MMDTDEPKEKEKQKKSFVRDVQKHLDKVAGDYVCPKDGSAEFAFVFIPSESVYYFLVTEAYETLREYTSRGVQVISPLTLAHKIELIRTGIHAKKLTDQAEQIREDIFALSKQFRETQGLWQTFYGTHLKNATAKADEIDQSYRKLDEEFKRISLLSGK